MPGQTPSLGRLMAGVALFVILGTPLVAYLWETLNVLLTGVVQPGRLLLAIPLALLFAGVLWLLARTVRAWGAETQGTRPPAP